MHSLIEFGAIVIICSLLFAAMLLSDYLDRVPCPKCHTRMDNPVLDIYVCPSCLTLLYEDEIE